MTGAVGEDVRSENTGRQGKCTIWEQNGAKSLDPADEPPHLLHIPHVVTQLVELLEVTVCAG
jgi:hypothetical protein